MRRAAPASCVALLLFAAIDVAGADAPLLQQRVQHPLNALFGLPPSASRAPAGGEWQVTIEHGNSFMGGVEGEELLALDGETSELSLRHRRRLGRCWQGEAHLPFVAHSGGWADRAIDDWHGLLGLPDAMRGLSPMFDLRYTWLDAEGRRRTLDRDVSGVGDVQFALQREIGCPPAGRSGSGVERAIVRAGIKLPSGDPDRLLGSGALDLFADVRSPVVHLGTRVRLAGTLGLLAPGDSELFGAQRALVGYGAFGLGYRLHRRWDLLVQIDWHTPFHDSALRELGETAAAISVGVRRVHARGGYVEFSISEDAVIDTSPDIVARLAWTWRPAPALPSAPGP